MLSTILALTLGLSTTMAQELPGPYVAHHVSVPAIDLQADVIPVGRDASGALQVPDAPETLGGFDQPANLLLVGTPQVYGPLSQLQQWDLVDLTLTNGDVWAFVVSWSRLYPTSDVPPLVYDGPADRGGVLTMITAEDLADGTPGLRVVRVVPMP